MTTPETMRSVLEHYTEDVALLNRCHDLPLCDADLEAKAEFFRACQEELGGVDFDALDPAGRIDYLLHRNLLDCELRKLDLERRRNEQVAPFVPFGAAIVELEQARRRLDAIDPADLAARLAELAQQVDEAREPLDAEESDAAMTPVDAARAAKMIDDLREALKRWFEFYNGYDPAFTWWTGDPYQKADAALEAHAASIRKTVLGIEDEKDEGPIVGDPIGRDALLNELAGAMIPYTPEELIAIGKREFEWCEREMLRASRDMGCGDDWRAALERVKKDHVPPGEQPRLIQELALEAVDYLREHDLVTIPPLAERTWRMEMIPPEKQKVNPFFTGGEKIRVSFPTNTMAHDEKLMSLRGNNVHFARATVHHELIPGHHLQLFMARRYQPQRRVFHTPFFVEGWALYWEMLLWDMGFPKTPENRVGMLFWRMHRAGRIVFSLEFHLGLRTPDECIDFLVNDIGHEPDNARGEVKRSFEGGYPPLYQCAYMIGGLQIRALRGELVASGKMTDREFHDALLRENAIPIEMVRASLTGQELTEDFRSTWRFAEEDADRSDPLRARRARGYTSAGE